MASPRPLIRSCRQLNSGFCGDVGCRRAAARRGGPGADSGCTVVPKTSVFETSGRHLCCLVFFTWAREPEHRGSALSMTRNLGGAKRHGGRGSARERRGAHKRTCELVSERRIRLEWPLFGPRNHEYMHRGVCGWFAV